MGEEKILKNFIKSKNLRCTPTRIVVLKEVYNTHNHFEPADLIPKMKKQGVSQATLYRTLNLFLECGLIKEVITGERHAHFEHVLGHRHHDHLVCEKCGMIIEFFDKNIEEFQEKICKNHNFKSREHRLEIFGLCLKCQE